MNAKKNTRDIQTDTLPAPTVEQAVDGRIEASAEFVTVDIPAYTGMAAGDTVTLIWNADVTGKYTDYVPVSAATAGHALTFEVPAEQIATNHEAAVSYEVAPASGGDTLSSLPLALQIGDPVLLPAPTVDEADGTSISVDDNPDGVTVSIPADAALTAGDLVTVYWVGTDGTGTTSVEATVTGSGAGKSLQVHIPAAVLEADEGTSVLVYYTVTRAASGAIETSATVVYNISGETPAEGGISAFTDKSSVANGGKVTTYTGADTTNLFLIITDDDISYDISWSCASADIDITSGEGKSKNISLKNVRTGKTYIITATESSSGKEFSFEFYVSAAFGHFLHNTNLMKFDEIEDISVLPSEADLILFSTQWNVNNVFYPNGFITCLCWSLTFNDADATAVDLKTGISSVLARNSEVAYALPITNLE